MAVRTWRHGVGFLALGLLLLMPSRASATAILTITDNSDITQVDATCAGCVVFDPTHHSNLENVGFHGEWNSVDPDVLGLGQSYTLNFHLCELTNSCAGPLTNPNTAQEQAVMHLETVFPTPRNANTGLNTIWFSDFQLIVLNDLPGPGDPSVGLFGFRDLSDILSITFSRSIQPGGNISVDGEFQSDLDVPEPASLLLLSTGLLGTGLIRRLRKRDKKA